MTTRDYLRRLKRNAILAQAGSALLLFAAIDLVGRLPQVQGVPPFFIFLALMIPFSFAMAYSSQWPACPACKASLYAFRLRPRHKHQVNFCPYCALRLDEPVPEPEPS
jgi:hypothetical protein